MAATSRRRTVLFATLRMTGVYVLLCAAVPWLGRWLTFPVPNEPPVTPAGAAMVETTARDGVTARAFRFDVPNAPLTVVFFHANAELASDEMELAHALTSHGYAAVFAEYRGYGVSLRSGAPTEKGVYADAEAILESTGAPRDRIVLYGYSLGTGVALEMASRGWGRAMVLIAPYTSIPDVAMHSFPIVPMRWLLRDEFDSRSKAPAIQIPVLIAHGDADDHVPFAMGQTLSRTFPHARLITVAGGNHIDLRSRDPQLMTKILDFLGEVSVNRTP